MNIPSMSPLTSSGILSDVKNRYAGYPRPPINSRLCLHFICFLHVGDSVVVHTFWKFAMTRTDAWAKPGGPKYIVGVTNFVHREALPKHASRAAIYRCVLQNLRLLPDPVIWNHVIPSLRNFCASPVKGQERSTEAEQIVVQMKTEAERKKTLASAKDVSGGLFRPRASLH